MMLSCESITFGHMGLRPNTLGNYLLKENLDNKLKNL
jgi:hypothetical protein